MIITLIAIFCKLYVFRQNLDNVNILVESLHESKQRKRPKRQNVLSV